MRQESSREDVVRLIRDLVDRKQTATLYIRTDRNRAVLLSLERGEIITLSSGPRHGESAIPILLDMETALVRTEPNAIAHRRDHMPPTEVVLTRLEAQAGASGDVGVGETERTGGAASDAGRVRAILARLLTDYMGPLAPMVCDQFLSPLGGTPSKADLAPAIEAIAAEIGTPEEAVAFTARAWEQLGL